MPVALQIVIPAHNEAGSIGATLREFHNVCTAASITAQFIVCEDGSIDGTSKIVAALAGELPVQLLSSPRRKGYSRAVIDGLRHATAPLICCVDGDGQYNPNDLLRLYHRRRAADIIIGCRAPRADPLIRKAMSWSFQQVYQPLLAVHLRDPSSPFVLMRRPVLDRVLSQSVGTLDQGFWWEFYARALAHNFTVAEVSISHRPRRSGQTQVYRPRRIPAIAYRHLRGLLQLKSELKAISRKA